GQGGIVQLSELLEARLLVLDAQRTRHLQMVGNLVTEDLQCALDPRTRGHRGTRRTSEVRIVEVRKAVRGRAHLAAHPPLLPTQERLVCAETCEHRTDRLAVTDDHAIDPPYFTRLRGDAEPP